MTYDPENSIFVFGSNRAGVHGAGAAYVANQHYGAIYGQGEGEFGESYALPTKDENIQTLPLNDIEEHVKTFIQHATDNPSKQYKVTCVGCGLAGLRDVDIAPMFRDAPDNCFFDTKWRDYLPVANFWGTF